MSRPNRGGTVHAWIDLHCEKCGLRVRLPKRVVTVLTGRAGALRSSYHSGARALIEGEPATCPGHGHGITYWLQPYTPHRRGARVRPAV